MSIKPRLKYFDLSMIIVSLVIGIGIFKTPAIVAGKAGSPLVFFSAWLLGGVISICGALTFAEIGSRYPVAGGFYKIFSHCYHPAYAFMLNWSLVIVNSASSVGVALVGAEYINPILLPADVQGDLYVKLTALAVVLLLAGLNYLGIRAGARTQNVLSSIKIVMILVFCCALFFPHAQHPSVFMPVNSSSTDFIKVLGISLISVFFTYGGYQNTINFGADIEDPHRNIPRSIFTGMAIVIALYLLINFAYYSVLGFADLQQSKLPAAELAQAFLGTHGAAIASVAIFISVLGFINTSLMSNPRVYYAMADDSILPAIFKKVNPNTMTQEFALGFFVTLMLLSLFVFGTFEKIVNYVMFIDSLSLVSAAGTIFIFRYRAKMAGDAAPVYQMNWYPFVPILFMLVLLAVTVNVFVSDRESALYGIAIFASGLPLYWLMKKLINKVGI